MSAWKEQKFIAACLGWHIAVGGSLSSSWKLHSMLGDAIIHSFIRAGIMSEIMQHESNNFA